MKFLNGEQAEPLLGDLAGWGNLTTIILHGGSVFEFKGPFPSGVTAEGYYNLQGCGAPGATGFEGHLNLAKVKQVELQNKQHRGRDSYSFVFVDQQDEVIFKIFLGREADGEVIASQLEKFQQLQNSIQAQG